MHLQKDKSAFWIERDKFAPIFGTISADMTFREKKRRKTIFNLDREIEKSRYINIQRPVNPKTEEPIEPAHKFEVTLEPDSFTEEKYALFENYQKSVHRETGSDVSRGGFKRFLCSGLKQSIENHDGREKKIGSYHQCYRLDGRLVAIGVLDLLPQCVSSVYLIYHQDVGGWKFGKLSALTEIDLAVKWGYGYYYMGYYIHSCIKMRYKGTYRPTYVLDPETYTWDPLDSDFLTRLSLRPYVSMSRERRLNIPPTALPMLSNLEEAEPESVDVYRRFYSPDPSQNVASSLDLPDYMDAQDPERHRNASSIFEAKTPGALTPWKVMREIPLGQWRLKLRMQRRIVRLEDLVSWEQDDMADPHSIKGVAAELAALFGKKLVEQTLLSL